MHPVSVTVDMYEMDLTRVEIKKNKIFSKSFTTNGDFLSKPIKIDEMDRGKTAFLCFFCDLSAQTNMKRICWAEKND